MQSAAKRNNEAVTSQVWIVFYQLTRNYKNGGGDPIIANDYIINKFDNPDTKAALKHLSQMKSYQPLTDFVFTSLRNDQRINNLNPPHEIITFIDELRPPDSTNDQVPAS